MIPNFKDNVARDSAVIYNSTWEQIKKLYAKNPQQAGELAISAFELALTGQISSDDFMVELLLENIKVVNEKNAAKYNKKVESQKNKKIEEQRLDSIAELYSKGMKQKDIAAHIGTTPQTISNRLALIRTEFPELLQKNQVNQVNQENQLYDNVNDNDNENENDKYGEICAFRTNPSREVCAVAQTSLNNLSQEERTAKFKRECGF